MFASFLNFFLHLHALAQMAKLVDALVSGTSVSDDVQVRVLFWAQGKVQRRKGATAQRRIGKKAFNLKSSFCLRFKRFLASVPLSPLSH